MTNELDRLLDMLAETGTRGRFPGRLALAALVDQCRADAEQGEDPVAAVQTLLAVTLLRQAADQTDEGLRRQAIDGAFAAARSAIEVGGTV